MKESSRQPSGKTDKKRDISSKTVLGNPILCAQFLRRNVNIPCLKNVQPETVMDVIVSVMESLCGKIGATEKETQECVSRVRERRMGYLFENMEKMNIQEERRNTAQEEAEESRIKSIINVCRKLHISKDEAIQTVIEECGIDSETARQKMDAYWEGK